MTSALTGFVVGAVTQSTSAVTIVASGLVQTGMLEVRRALPLLSWTNVGTCGVVLMASLDPRTVALVLVGTAGVLAFFRLDLAGRLAPLLGALIGLGTVFLGLGIIKAGVAPLRDSPVMQALMGGAGGWLLPPFLAGAAVAFLSQTASTATLIALTFTATGLIGFDQTAMAVYGATIGAGLGMLLAGGELRGTPRRLAQYQVLWRCCGATLFLGLFLLERAGVPLVLAASEALAGGDLAFRVGVLVLIFQGGSAILAWPLDRIALRLLATWSPETPAEALSRPRFVHAAAAGDPPTALALAAREAASLAARLPALLDAARDEAGGPGRGALGESSAALERTLDAFLAGTLAQPGIDAATLEGLVALRARLADLAALREAADGLSALAEDAAREGAAQAPVLRRMAEALHLLLTEFAAALDASEPAEAAGTLAALTSDRSAALDGIRRGLTRAEAGLGQAEQEALLRAMALFERAAWLMRRQSLALLPPPATRA
jgi:phosphate:Na+ symporter